MRNDGGGLGVQVLECALKIVQLSPQFVVGLFEDVSVCVVPNEYGA